VVARERMGDFVSGVLSCAGGCRRLYHWVLYSDCAYVFQLK
jgi:hypothetical protein